MAYNDFTLAVLRRQFGLQIQEEADLFASAEPISISEWLQQTLQEYVPLALEISTEKARSEFIIAPILGEVRRQLNHRISLFSGVEFNVDLERGLRGVCDFLFSLSPLQLSIEAPVVAIVEAKNENIKQGIVQCIAEMVAAQQFNGEQGNLIGLVFGAVTTGSNWKFLRLQESMVTVDTREYYLKEIEQIIGVLISMLRQSEASQGSGDD